MTEISAIGQRIARLAEGHTIERRDGLTPAAIVEWSRRNKFPLLALAPHAPDWLSQDSAFDAALEAERTSYTMQRNEYTIARDAWRARGIDCLMIKSAGNAPSFPHTSDNIDILVQPQDGPAARDTLRQLGYVELRNIEEPHKFLFRRFRGGESVSAIHVHEQVLWLVGFMDEPALWSRRRVSADDPAVTIPSPEDAILINLAHACYENKVLRFNDIIRVRHALRTAGTTFDWGYLETVALARGWRDGLAFMLLTYAHLEPLLFGNCLIPMNVQEHLERIVAEERYAARRLATVRTMPRVELPTSLSYRFCKWLYYRKIWADSLHTAPEKWYDTVMTLLVGIKLKSGIRPQPGMLVTLSGPDGSGKTTHAEALLAALAVCGLKTTYVWSRGGSTGLLGAVSALRRRGSKVGEQASTAEDPIARRQRQLAHPLVRLAWSWLVAFDGLSTAYLRMALPAWRGRIVIADRYVYDTAAEMDATLPANDRASRLAIDALLRLAPRPDHAYLLTVPPDTAQSRRPDERLAADGMAERRRYSTLASHYRLRHLPNDGAFGMSNDRLVRETLMGFMAGFVTRLNGLFMGNPHQKNQPDPIWERGGTR
ncbi:MAG TPA: nucleotidyltransferase family protein [Thermomicrobiales bacterium]|jgi:thymidylate kinase